MNGLGVTLEEDEICTRLRAALLCEQFCGFANGGAKLSINTVKC